MILETKLKKMYLLANKNVSCLKKLIFVKFYKYFIFVCLTIWRFFKNCSQHDVI
jgi:hypothetical protein